MDGYDELDLTISLSAWTGSLSEDEAAAQAMWRAGFHPGNAHAWYDVAFQALGIGRVSGMAADDVAKLASMWQATGMPVDRARAWVDQPVAFAEPFHEPQVAMRWSQGGFTPDEAAQWHGRDRCHGAFTPDVAAAFHHAHWDASEASLLFTFAARLPDAEDTVEWATRWIDSGLSPADVLDFTRAGVTPQEGPVFARWTNKTHLREELESRESLLDNFRPGPAEEIAVIQRILQRRYSVVGPDRFFLKPYQDRHFATDKNGNRVVLREDGICPGTGATGKCQFKDGWEEWWVVCPVCGTTWMGGSGTIDEHDDTELKRIS